MSDLGNHNFKIQTLDQNIMAIAGDMESFQSAVNKMNVALLELQEANKDVLVGKKSFNCLSCGKDDGLPSMNFQGKDGNIYKTFNNAFPNQHSKKNYLGDETSPVKIKLGGVVSAENKYGRRQRARIQSASMTSIKRVVKEVQQPYMNM